MQQDNLILAVSCALAHPHPPSVPIFIGMDLSSGPDMSVEVTIDRDGRVHSMRQVPLEEPTG